MGIMTVRDEGPGRHRRQGRAPGRRRAQPTGEVIIQEGVLTGERIHDAVAEPVVYMIDRYVVGGFYRIHAERGIDENLNAPGALRALALPATPTCRAPAPRARRARPTASTCTA
jgi:glutamate--cysteine ligase